MWSYPGLLTVVHMVRMKWEEIQGWNVPSLAAHSAVAMCLSLGGDVALALWWARVALFAPPAPRVPLPSPSPGQSPPPSVGLGWCQAPLSAAQEPVLASAASRKVPQGRTGSPPLLPFISHPSLSVPSCFNFNCWTCCWTLGHRNSVFFKCKNSQCCLFGGSVFSNAIFLHKSAFSHMMDFTCVSPGDTANPVWGYMFSYVQGLKKNPTIFFLIFLFSHFSSFGSGICGAGDPDGFWRAGLLLPTLFCCCSSAPWK